MPLVNAGAYFLLECLRGRGRTFIYSSCKQGFKLLYSSICSLMESLRAVRFLRLDLQARHLVSEQHWHILQSGHGCLCAAEVDETICGMRSIMLV